MAVKSLCELLVALPHFNFHNNIIVLIVPLMNDVSKSVGCSRWLLLLSLKEMVDQVINIIIFSPSECFWSYYLLLKSGHFVKHCLFKNI